MSILRRFLLLVFAVYATPASGQATAVPRPARNEQVVGHVEPARYWIVSSRNCPQSSGSIHCCRLQYYRYDCRSGLNSSSRCEFQSEMIPGAPVCIMIHGSFVDWQSACEQSFQTWRWLRNGQPNLPLNIVFYTWPSDRGISPLPQIDVGILGRAAARNGFLVANFVHGIPQNSPICLLGHSHGARMTVAASHLLGGGEIQGYRLQNSRSSHRVRAVLAAAALDHQWMNPGERYDRALCRLECLLNIRSDLDIALRIYPLRQPFGHRALGQSGFTSRDLRELGAFSCRIRELEVTPILGTDHEWPYFYSQPGIANAIAPFVYFPGRYARAQQAVHPVETAIGPLPALPE